MVVLNNDNAIVDLAERLVRIDDIRGRWPDVLSPDIAVRIADNMARWLNAEACDRIICGHDGRKASIELMNVMVPRLQASGIQVGLAGLMASPALVHSMRAYDFKAGIVFTASHNPLGYAGLKMLVGSEPPSLEVLRSFLTSEPNVALDAMKDSSSPIHIDCIDPWVRATVLPHVTHTFVFDCLNGPSGPLIKAIASRLGPGSVIIGGEQMPDYGGRNPDPTAHENIDNLAVIVRSSNAVLGFSFDGDGDRCVVVDSGGQQVPPDLIVCLLIMLEPKTFASGVAVDVKASSLVETIAKQYGIPVLRMPTGQFHMRNALTQGVALSAELSGHYCFAASKHYDDGIYAALKIIETISPHVEDVDIKLRSLRDMRIISPEYRLPIVCADKNNVMQIITNRAQNRKLISDKTDGIRIIFPDLQIIIRKSMTEEVMSIRFEGRDRKSFDMSQDITKNLVGGIVDTEGLQ